MAVRLQMKLGVIAEPDRVTDSPDTVVVVEPSVGSVARSKGNLYLIVTSTVASQRAQEATQLAAETIRSEYYYDESAGIRVCLEKAIASANKRLAHQRDRLNLHGDGVNGPIGIGVAVVRGNELYVATIGPAEAYLIRQARLSTLPDPHRERGLPTKDLEPDVWRGEISVGDSLVLISPNVMSRLGPDELKDAMVTLHPQPAMEHLHHRFVASDGAASDGMIAIEATEVASTHKSRALVPVRPAEPLAGAPDRSPIPLADNVTDGVAAVQASAFRARAAAGGALERLVVRFQELLPRRRTAYRRVTPAAAKREMQRRAAVAILALVVVSGGLFTVVWAVGGQNPGKDLASLTVGEAALRTARDNIGEVFGPGVDLVDGDPSRALELLTGAYAALDTAAKNEVPASTINPLRKQAQAGLDRLYGVVPVAPATIVSFTDSEVPFDIGDMILGPGGVPFVLDRATKSIYRVDLGTRTASLIYREGTKASGTTEGAPKLMALGATRDLLVVDSANVLWRWRPADEGGKGTIIKVTVSDGASWGDDIRAIGTFLRVASTGLYNLYVVDPSEEQLVYYFPAHGRQRLPGGAGRPAGGRPQHGQGRRPVHRRRHLPRRRRQDRPVRRWPGRGLGGRSAARHAAAEGAGLPPDHLGDREAEGRPVRLRPDERPGRRDRQGQGVVPRPIPAGRRRSGLGGPARDVRRPGRGRGPVDAHLGDEGRRLLVDPRRGPGRSNPLAVRLRRSGGVRWAVR